MTLLEKAARALADKAGAQTCRFKYEQAQAYFDDAVRAVLEALMEPSEEIYAGARSVDIVRACGEGIETHHLVRCPEEGIDEVRDMWQAMLCEVLKDKP